MRKGWEKKKLGEVCIFLNRGISPKYTENNGLNVINQKCIRNHEINFTLGRLHNVKLKEVPKEKLIKVGDVLVNSTGTGTLGRVAQVKHDAIATVDSHVTIVRPLENLFYLPFFGYAMHFIENEITDSGEGCGGQTELSREKLKNQFYISFPNSLSEQERIVSLLDESFSAIAKAKANAEKNLKNAREIFESYLENLFNNNSYLFEFGEVCILEGGSQPSKSKFIYQPKEGYIRLVQVRDYRTDKFATFIPKSLAKRFCNKDEIMIGRYGPPIFGIFKGLEGAYNVALMKAIVNEKICEREYFYWFLHNNKIKKFVEHSSKRAVGQDGVRKELLEKYPVPIPSIKAQKQMVLNINSILRETQKLESIYQKKLADLEELKKSILQKAFSGVDGRKGSESGLG